MAPSPLPLLARLALPALIAGGAVAAEADPPVLVVDAPPGVQYSRDAVIYPNGILAHYGDLVLLADTMRLDVPRQDIWAEGRVVLVRSGFRLHAKRLGLHLRGATTEGEAWDVEAWIDGPTGRLPVRAEHVRMGRDSVVFSGVTAGPRHGGILTLGARTLTVRLAADPDPTRHDAARFVRDVTAVGPYVTLMRVPVFWLPWLYRDLSFDYPWTRIRFGDSSRLGRYIRFDIGTGLPEVAGWKTRVGGAVDYFDDAGTGFGASLDWKHATWGKGLAKWYGLEPEHVTDADGASLGDANHHVIDLEHRAAIPGGAVSARWVELPEPDPGAPLERFRADYLREDLETRPFARRGVTAAWGAALGTLVADIEHAPLGDPAGTDRDLGLQGRLADLHLVGPVHAIADAWLEHLRNEATDNEVTRLTATAGLRALQWFGGIGADAGAGARGLLYADGTLAGVEQQEDPWRAAPFADAGLRLRLAHTYGGGLFHQMTPRVGVELIGEGRHDALPAYTFADGRDDFEEDRRYLVTSLDTSVTRGRELFHADLLARWALRGSDRVAEDDEGVAHTGDGPLAQLAGVVTGRPTRSFTIDADLLYDARTEDWERFDIGSRWDALSRASLLYSASYNPLPGISDRWDHRPGIELRGNRYTSEARVSLRPGGASVDGVQLQLIRRAADARLALTFELVRDEEGGSYEQRWGASVTLP